MFELFLAKFGDVGGQFGVAVAQFVELSRIVTVDLCLDRVRASHRCFFGDQSGGGAKHEPGNVPYWLERSGANAALGEQGVKTVEMALFLTRHAGYLVRGVATLGEHSELSGINPSGAVFAGLVDAQHAGRVGPAITRTPAGHALAFLSRTTMAVAEPSEMSAFHPAMLTDRKEN